MNADATVARTALEQVCARGDLELAQECYAPDFVDHVNALDFHGHEGSGNQLVVYREELALGDLLPGRRPPDARLVGFSSASAVTCAARASRRL